MQGDGRLKQRRRTGDGTQHTFRKQRRKHRRTCWKRWQQTQPAERTFAGIDGANRYAVIYRVQDAKNPETRARRIAQYVEMLARGETIHPRKG
jgi:Bacteriocin-protection, YdeI or OmpD-Associated